MSACTSVYPVIKILIASGRISMDFSKSCTPVITGIDTRGLNEAVRTGLDFSQRTPPIAVATAGFFVARKAINLTHRANVGQIDSALGVVSAPVLVTRKGSKRLGQPLKSGRRKVMVPEKSLASWIILARMQHTSGVNIRENWRYVLNQAAFSPGGGVSGFWAKINQMAKQMIGARHKSIAFIASSLLPVIRDLEPHVPPKYRRGMPPSDGQVEQAGKISESPKGRATVSSGSNSAVMEGQALIGVNGQPDNLNDPHNQAMMTWLAPAIQIAVYDEECKTLVYIAIKGEAEERRAKFASSGVTLDV